jgi:hypothetical protein
MIARGDPVIGDHRVVALIAEVAGHPEFPGGPAFHFLGWMPPWVTTPIVYVRNEAVLSDLLASDAASCGSATTTR